ncbi:exonuclease [Natrarchaeobaculum sulfurireducens]|uniref:Putative exonuclease RecJ n=1 Tax=Natrarchaeobaculum sulfurireducens TaxID=2044521 RepID=A0A346PPN2_9EURY|nr:exonuclease [Natrarchaeobaculum sulfurireducens]AXR78450.1 hypothetical protein AArc1_2133 [Natrarchaeobaculum sulfurireducens]AXR81477.1 putative exonuclease RecJ [Natrarchaeobaculum sulfurireducens]
MSVDGRSADQPPLTPGLESAGFVRLITRADGDALAASGIIARSLAERGTPFQVAVRRTVSQRTARMQAPDVGDDELLIAVGAVDAEVPRVDAPDRPATLAALELARDLETTPDPMLALAGLVAAGVEPGAGESEWVLESAIDRDLVERRPGIAIPTAAPVDGLAYSTRLRAPWSGDREATADALGAVGVDPETTSLEPDLRQTVGSVVALDVVGAKAANERAADTVAQTLNPYATPAGPFETVGGYADVLEATARIEPGTGAALAMGHDAHEPALAAWRRYGRRAHEALSSASTGRYDGLFVVEIDDGPVEAVARIAAAYRSPEPTTLVVGPEEAALVAHEELSASTVERIARDLASEGDVEYDVGRRRGYLRFEPALDESTIIACARESV